MMRTSRRLHSNGTLLFAVEARRQLAAGEPRRAIETCKMGLARHPDHAAGYVVLAAAYRSAGEPDRARLVLMRGYERTGLDSLRALSETATSESTDVPVADDTARQVAAEHADGAQVAIASRDDVAVDRLEEARREAERIEAERLEAERLEAERIEAARLETARLEAERLEADRLEVERLEAERVEAEKVEAERIEAQRVEAQRIEAERFEAERVEAERVEAARIEADRLEAERLEAERVETERAETERLERTRIEAERVEAERAHAEPEQPTNEPEHAPEQPATEPSHAPEQPAGEPSHAPEQPASEPAHAPEQPASEPSHAPEQPAREPSHAPEQPTTPAPGGGLSVIERRVDRPVDRMPWLQRQRQRTGERTQGSSLALHSGKSAHRLTSANLRLIPGLEFAPLRAEDQGRRMMIAPIMEDPLPEWEPRRRTTSVENAPPLPEYPATASSRAAIVSADVVSPVLEPMSVEETAIAPVHVPVDEPAPDTSAIDELARRLEGARIAPVGETVASKRHVFEPSIVSDTLADILVAQGAYGEAMKAYMTLARMRPAQLKYYEERIAEMKRRILEEGVTDE
jgi:hypothetical protein